MCRLVGALIGSAVGYVPGVAVGAALAGLLSANTHDKNAELAMTSLLVVGPIGALVGLVIGLVRGGRAKSA